MKEKVKSERIKVKGKGLSYHNFKGVKHIFLTFQTLLTSSIKT